MRRRRRNLKKFFNKSGQWSVSGKRVLDKLVHEKYGSLCCVLLVINDTHRYSISTALKYKLIQIILLSIGLFTIEKLANRKVMDFVSIKICRQLRARCGISTITTSTGGRCE